MARSKLRGVRNFDRTIKKASGKRRAILRSYQYRFGNGPLPRSPTLRRVQLNSMERKQFTYSTTASGINLPGFSETQIGPQIIKGTGRDQRTGDKIIITGLRVEANVTNTSTDNAYGIHNFFSIASTERGGGIINFMYMDEANGETVGYAAIIGIPARAITNTKNTEDVVWHHTRHKILQAPPAGNQIPSQFITTFYKNMWFPLDYRDSVGSIQPYLATLNYNVAPNPTAGAGMSSTYRVTIYYRE